MATEIALVILVSLGLLTFALVSKRRRAQTSKEETHSTSDAVEDEEFVDLNEKFLRNFRGGDVVKLVKTYQAEDYMMIRSVLDGAGILSYSEFETMNSLFPGVPIAGYSEAYISVPSDDVDEAKLVVSDYISERRKSLRDGARPPSVGGKVVKALLDVEGLRGNLPELLVKK